jgi:uncharacterized protein
LRVVAVEGVLLPDLRGTSSGRGAHLHPDPGCLALAERRRAFTRAFRLEGPLRADALQEYVNQQHHDQDRQQHLDKQSGTTP